MILSSLAKVFSCRVKFAGLRSHLLADATQVRIGTVKMHKRQIAADIPYAFIAFRHQTKTIRAAAIFQPCGVF